MARRDYDDEDYTEDDERPVRSKTKTKTKTTATAERRRRDDDEEEPPRRRVSKSRDDDDAEDEEPPRRRASKSRDEEEEDEPPRRSRSRRDDDDDDDEEPPRRSRSRRDDADEDEPPRRARARRDDDDDDDRDEAPRSRSRSSRRADEDDDDDRSAPRRRPAKRHLPQGGWAEAQKVSDSTSTFAKSFSMKAGDPDQVIKFLDDAPYVNYRRHWIDELSGKKSWTCLDGLDPKGCPMCDSGHKASGIYCFNILVLSEHDDPVLRSFDCGPQMKDALFNFNNDKATGPLTQNYYVAKRPAGKNSRMSLSPIKARDLYEDYGVDPLAADEIADFAAQKHDKSIAEIPSYKALDEIRRSLED